MPYLMPYLVYLDNATHAKYEAPNSLGALLLIARRTRTRHTFVTALLPHK